MGMEATNVLFSPKKLSKRQGKRIFRKSNVREKLGQCYGDINSLFESELVINNWHIYFLETRKSTLDEYMSRHNFKDCKLLVEGDEWGHSRFVENKDKWVNKYIGENFYDFLEIINNDGSSENIRFLCENLNITTDDLLAILEVCFEL